MTQTTVEPKITAQDQRDLIRNLGVERLQGAESLTVQELSSEVSSPTDPAFASMGESIRRNLSGSLDADLLKTELGNTAAAIARLPEVRDAGVPDESQDRYGAVAASGWRAYEHLADVGFFESVEASLPRFTPDYIAHTARELILADPLQSELGEVGFDEREKIALLMNVVNNNTRLARWVPTKEIPEEVEFDLSFVPPLHQRAVGGALLWIRDLDGHLWRNEVLVTDAILDDAVWRVKALLGGLYVVLMAARDIADEGRLTDGQLTAALTAGAAIDIISQEELMKEVYYITDEMRAPRGGE